MTTTIRILLIILLIGFGIASINHEFGRQELGLFDEIKQIPFVALCILTILLAIVDLKAQNAILAKETIEICDKIVFIDSLEFNKNRQHFKIIDTTSIIGKTKGQMNVPGKDTSFIFKDDTSDEGFFEYTFAGQDINKRWVLILGQDYNQDYYYLINQNTNKTDTLVGYPRIFGDKYLCEESSYTDGTAFIGIWSLKNNEFKLIERLSLKPCKIYAVNESYLKNDFLYIRYEFEKYLRIKL